MKVPDLLTQQAGEIATRLKTVERELGGVEALEEERDELRAALRALDGVAVRPPRTGGKPPRDAAHKAILDLAAQSPGITAGDVVEATGMARTTAAATLTQLRRAGALEKRERGYAVASKWGWHDDKPEVPA
jgi:DNA-binding transcriptional ArsR family regulator